MKLPRLRGYRTDAGLSQPQLAQMAGIARQTVGVIEGGANTTILTTKKLAKALDLALPVLMEGGRDD